MLKNLFKKTFDIRDGEIRISFFMQLYIFLLISVLLMVKPTINALFLSKLGADHLPYGYILVAIIAVITSYFYNKAIRSYSLKRITISTLVFFSMSFIVLGILMYNKALNEWVLYTYYLSVALFAVLVTSQFWVIANLVFNAREAKRLFGFIGAGAIAGGIFGGYITSLIAPIFGNVTVIILAAFFILLCIPLIQVIWRLRIKKMSSYSISQKKVAANETYSTPYKIIIKSKHLSYLAAIVGVGVIMAKLVDYQFSDFANRAIPDTDELASFFGFWFSSFNVVALLIQLFVTNRVLAWLGVTTSLMILPLGIAVGCLLFLTFPELWVLILIKGMDGSFKQSLNKAGIELAILPIPLHIKSQAKSYIDVVVDSIATGLAGLLLIFVIKKLNLSTSYITVIIIFILFIWMFLIYKLREAYFESFRNNIQSAIVQTEKPRALIKRRINLNTTINILRDGTEAEILYTLNNLQEYQLRTLESQITKLLDNPSIVVKKAAIEQLYFFKKGAAATKIEQLIFEKNDGLVYKAMEYLLYHTLIDDSQIYNKYLDHSSSYISQAALLCLAKESQLNQKLADNYNLHDRIQKQIRELFLAESATRKEEIAELLMTIAHAKEPKFYSFISTQFYNKEPYIVGYAIKAAGISAHEPFVDTLLNFLAEKQYRKVATKALKNFGVGIITNILKKDKSQSFDESIKRYLPKVVESFKNREAIRVLMRLLNSKDFVIRLEAAKSLNNIRKNGAAFNIDQRKLTRVILRESSYYRNSINTAASIKGVIEKSGIEDILDSDLETDKVIALENLLEILSDQLQQSLDAIFQLLSLKYDQVDIETAYFGLQSELRETKINALEFLDNLLQSRLKNAVLPSIEHHIIDAEGNHVSDYEVKILNEKQALLRLLKNRGARMKVAVVQVMQYSDDASYINRMIPLLKHKNQKVRISTKHALDELRSRLKK